MPDYPVSDVRFADANGSSIAYMVYGDGEAVPTGAWLRGGPERCSSG